MSDEVYANGREIACKASGGKSIACFPDVCFTPPQTPATPPGVPLPYPNTALSSDTTEGSKTVQISGQEVMLKDQSNFKKSAGNEAGSAPKKGLVSSKNTSTAFFAAWSMDVVVESENVVRHLDLMTHNHGAASNTGPWPFTSKANAAKGGACNKEVKKEKKACADYDPHTKGGASPCKDAGLMKKAGSLTKKDAKRLAEAIQSGTHGPGTSAASKKALKCVRARRCKLGPYSPSQCCPSQTPDHVLPKASFYKTSTEGARLPGWGGDDGYKPDKAPCMCAEGPNNSWGSHGLRHRHHKGIPPVVGGKTVARGKPMPFKKGTDHASDGSSKVFKASGCSKKCIKAQVDNGHADMHEETSPPEVKYAPSGRTETPKEITKQMKTLNGDP